LDDQVFHELLDRSKRLILDVLLDVRDELLAQRNRRVLAH